MDTTVNLKAKIAAYLQKTSSDLTVNGVDLGLDAINRAHQWALMKYDFELAKVFVTLSVDLTSGGVISPATLFGTGTLVTVKKILKAYFAVSGSGGTSYRPINFVPRSSEAGDLKRVWEGHPWSERADPANLYNDISSVNTPTLFQLGPSVFVYPGLTSVWGTTNPLTIALDAVRYFPDYALDTGSSNDFILEFGDDFLFWDSIVRLNKYFQQFVPRQEGNITPGDLDKERATAWSDFLAWDAGLVFTGSDALSLD